MCRDLFIYYNDTIDSDNWAAALALMRAMGESANSRIVWILEPRQVLFCPTIASHQQARCQELITRHFAQLGNPFKVLLGGLLKEAQIEAIEGLSPDDKQLVTDPWTSRTSSQIEIP